MAKVVIDLCVMHCLIRDNEGITSQNIPLDRSMTFNTSFVSIYSHVMAKTDTIGTDANIEPKNELCFAISDIRTTITDVIIIFSF